MKTLTLPLFILCFAFSALQAQQSFPETSYTALSTIDLDEDWIVCHGSCGQIYYSDNDGSSWTKMSTNDTYYDLEIIPDTDKVMMVGSRLGIGSAVSILDLENQSFEHLALPEQLMEESSIRLVERSGDDFFAIGFESVYKTSAEDWNWELVYQDTFESDYISRSAITSQHLILGGRYGKLVRVDLSDNEAELMHDFEAWITDIEMGNDEVGYIKIQSFGNLYKTTDAWENLAEIETAETINPQAFGSDILVTVNTNRIYVSEDGGASFEYIQTANTAEMSLTTNATFDENGNLYVVGRGAMIARSANLGQSWEHLNSNERRNFYTSYVDEDGNHYVGGEDGVLYSSQDKGENWSAMNIAFPEDAYIYDMLKLPNGRWLFANNEGLHIVEDGSIIATREGEAVRLLYNSSGNYLIMIAYDPVDNEYKIYKSLDNGDNWTVQHIFSDYPNTLSQSIEGTLWTNSYSGGALKSEDDGATWTSVDFGFTQMREVNFYNDMVGLIATGSALHRTEDGGQTFTQVGSGYAIGKATFIDELKFVYTTRQNNWTNLRYTEDSGENYTTIFKNCNATNHISTDANRNYLVAQDAGYAILVPTEEEPSTTIFEQSDAPTINIFPNPINKNTSIQFNGIWETLEMYSITGKMIWRKNIKGVSELQIDNNPGTYFLKAFGEEGQANGKLIIQ